jgi:hypothetical protein
LTELVKPPDTQVGSVDLCPFATEGMITQACRDFTTRGVKIRTLTAELP